MSRFLPCILPTMLIWVFYLLGVVYIAESSSEAIPEIPAWLWIVATACVGYLAGALVVSGARNVPGGCQGTRLRDVIIPALIGFSLGDFIAFYLMQAPVYHASVLKFLTLYPGVLVANGRLDLVMKLIFCGGVVSVIVHQLQPGCAGAASRVSKDKPES